MSNHPKTNILAGVGQEYVIGIMNMNLDDFVITLKETGKSGQIQHAVHISACKIKTPLYGLRNSFGCIWSCRPLGPSFKLHLFRASLISLP